MVSSAGAPIRPDRVHALKLPRPIEVTVDDGAGQPRMVCERKRCRTVVAVEDAWLVETEWWRPRPQRRRYFQLLVQNDATITVYQDLVDGLWYAQVP